MRFNVIVKLVDNKSKQYQLPYIGNDCGRKLHSEETVNYLLCRNGHMPTPGQS